MIQELQRLGSLFVRQAWMNCRSFGDMSLVGTRPPTVDEFEQYEGYHKRRLSMTPGLTGVWQVSGRSDITDFEEIVSMDVEYIKNWSLKRDIEIILKTVQVVLHSDGAR